MFKIIILLLCLGCNISHANQHNYKGDELLLTKTKIEKMAAQDQAIRLKILTVQKKFGTDYILTTPKYFDRMKQMDRKNEMEIQKILVRWGWPDKKIFGEKTSKEFWLLIQHADHNLTLQKKALITLTKIAKKDKTELTHFAYLYDRVQMHLHLSQRYGTQGICQGKHQWQPFELEQINNLDSLRQSVGLGRFEDYRKLMNQFCL